MNEITAKNADNLWKKLEPQNNLLVWLLHTNTWYPSYSRYSEWLVLWRDAWIVSSWFIFVFHYLQTAIFSAPIKISIFTIFCLKKLCEFFVFKSKTFIKLFEVVSFGLNWIWWFADFSIIKMDQIVYFSGWKRMTVSMKIMQTRQMNSRSLKILTCGKLLFEENWHDEQWKSWYFKFL